MVQVYGVYEAFYGRLLFSRCCRLVCSARALRGEKKSPFRRVSSNEAVLVTSLMCLTLIGWF